MSSHGIVFPYGGESSSTGVLVAVTANRPRLAAKHLGGETSWVRNILYPESVKRQCASRSSVRQVKVELSESLRISNDSKRMLEAEEGEEGEEEQDALPSPKRSKSARPQLQFIRQRCYNYNDSEEAVIGVDLMYENAPVSKSMLDYHLPTKCKIFTLGSVKEYKISGPLVLETDPFEKLLSLWIPDHESLPALPITFEQLWDLKKKQLEALCDATKQDGRFWKVDFESIDKKYSSTTFIELAMHYASAFEKGMVNGLAKRFILSLVNFMLQVEAGHDDILREHLICSPMANWDAIFGQVRYQSSVEFETSQSFPQRRDCGKRNPSGYECTSSTGGSSGSSKTLGVGKVHKLTPDCIIGPLRYLFITSVFECTRRSYQDFEHSQNQNIRQMISLIHYQKAIMGCLVTPFHYIFNLIIRNDDDNDTGKQVGTMKLYNSGRWVLEKSGGHFNKEAFLEMAKMILRMSYINVQCLRLLSK